MYFSNEIRPLEFSLAFTVELSAWRLEEPRVLPLQMVFSPLCSARSCLHRVRWATWQFLPDPPRRPSAMVDSESTAVFYGSFRQCRLRLVIKRVSFVTWKTLLCTIVPSSRLRRRCPSGWRSRWVFWPPRRALVRTPGEGECCPVCPAGSRRHPHPPTVWQWADGSWRKSKLHH